MESPCSDPEEGTPTQETPPGSNGNSFGGPTPRFCDYFVICGLDYTGGLEALTSHDLDGEGEQNSCLLEIGKNGN